MKKLLLITGFLILFAAEILRVYFIMPFPGSQQSDTINIAYWLGNNIGWIRIIGLLLIAFSLARSWHRYKLWHKILTVIFIGFYATIFYFFNFRFEADKMFYQPQNKLFTQASKSDIDSNKLVIGVAIKGEAKAYPIKIIGYHHQVRDTLGGEPVMVTYCTVCRTGRVFSPLVNGKSETFRLVGMDHFNAMFEDATTKSWWQQATGVAITGKLKGTRLPEISSEQMTLKAWLNRYPNSTVLQPDTLYTSRYKGLADYDNGTIDGSLEHRDSASWKFKSWVVGITYKQYAKAYDWNELASKKIIEDSLPDLPLIIVLENDNTSFHVWNRNVNNKPLQFTQNNIANTITDTQTNSVWSMSGTCVEGSLKGSQLQPIQAYQEFWHSWQTFHPGTMK